MRLTLNPKRLDAANTLAVVLVTGGVMGIVIAGSFSLSSFTLKSAHNRTDWNAAFYHAENALQWAAQGVADADPTTASNYYSTASGTLTLAYMASARSNADSGFKNAWVSVARSSTNDPNYYLVTASARVNDRVRTIQANVRKSPASLIFDYEYFLNNWGWWWGSPIYGNGGNRSNWDFDFRDKPTVNGEIVANGYVTSDGTPVNPLAGNPPFVGTAGSDPLSWVHAGVPRLPMPNLKDFGYYTNKAMQGIATNGIWVGTNRVVYAVQTNASQPGLYLDGTASGSPITINGTVVVPGDVVIKGKITGHGTLYVGGNLYVAGDLTYNNGPTWSAAPETMTSAQRDQWVSDNKNKDLVGFAVRESIFAGDVTDTSGSGWKGYCYDAATYGLKNVGDESHLGADGIAGTPDDNIPYLDTNGDGVPDSTWYDADGDGVVDGNFNYNTQITMTTSGNNSRAGGILGYPTDTHGNLVAYNSLASNNMNSLDGVFYTNHAAAMRLARDKAVFHGVIVSRNEAIVFNKTLTFTYDSRVHSRYNNDPNRYVDLGLPPVGMVQIQNFTELQPDWANL